VIAQPRTGVLFVSIILCCAWQNASREPTMKSEWFSGYSYVLPGHQEEAAVGLYTYLLFGARSAVERSRLTEALDAVRGPAELEASVFTWTQRRENFPLVFIFVNQPIEQDYSQPDQPGDELIGKVDFNRSIELLRLVLDTSGRGPYLVTSLRPLLRGTTVDSHLLIDMSNVSDGAVPTIIRAFKRATLEEQTPWDVLMMREWTGRFEERLNTLATTDVQLYQALPNLKVEWRTAYP
jgi:hypothetical protein